jgi:hypothetical protein
MRVSGIVGSDGVDSGQMSIFVQRQKSSEGRVQAEIAIEVKTAGASGTGPIRRRSQSYIWPGASIIVVSTRNQETESIGSTTKEKNDNDILVVPLPMGESKLAERGTQASKSTNRRACTS